MSKMKHITVRIDEKLFQKISNFTNEQNVSNFIRQAIQNELSGETKSAKKFAKMAKNIEDLDSELLQQKVYDLQLQNQIILELILKQNEILKLIHRRTTITTGYCETIINNLADYTKLKGSIYDKAIEVINKDLEKINFN